MKKTLLYIAFLVFAGCYEPSGGGSVHNPPENIESGKPIILKYELSLWGGGSKDVEKRYKKVKCHYKLKNENEFRALDMKLVKKDVIEGEGIYKCTIPASIVKSGVTIEYYFDEYFDGHYNKRKEKPIKVP